MSKHLACLSRVLGGAVSPVAAARDKYKVLIVGGGAAGCSVASQLLRKLGFPMHEVAVVEPRDQHYYQPKWTMVGGLGLDVKTSARPMAQVMPLGVDWVKERCETFQPELNRVVLGNGQQLEYDVLVVAAGLQQNFGGIKGLAETVGKNGVASIYSFDYSPNVWENVQATKQGRAIFTNPSTPVNCGGAPQKIAYLAEDAWRKMGVRDRVNVEYFTPSPAVFACRYYAEALAPMMVQKGITANLKSNLVEVDGENRLATFEREDGEIFTKDFEFLHVTPPMSAPSFLQKSPLANAAGFVDVDKQTCRHNKYGNVFSLGDCSSLPTSKTYSAVSSQAPVVVHNVRALLDQKPQEATASYGGYTACPILSGGNKLMLAEFNGYTMEPEGTFWPLDQRKPNLPFFLMKRFVFEEVYWHLMPIGMWYGSRTIFEPPIVHKKLEAKQEEASATPVMPWERLSLQAKFSLSPKDNDAGANLTLQPSLFGIETPPVPGNVSLCGSLPAEAVTALGPRYKGWLYLNPADHPDFHKQEIERAGCEVRNVHLPGGYSGGVPTSEHAQQLLVAMKELPRPLMVQCTSGNRSGAALMLWLSKTLGRNVDAASLLAQDMDLRFFHCAACGPVWDWLSKEIGDVGSSLKQEDNSGFVLEQLFDTTGSSTFTYLLGCNQSREAVLIDPVLGMEERDLHILGDRGLKLKYVLNTHCHADHVTSGAAIKKLRPEVKTMIAKSSGAQADMLLEDGDRVEFGNFSLEALATPGHTSGCMSFHLVGPGDPLAVFTGDTLLIRGCGRTDFQQGNAEQLYQSIQQKIFSLPDSTRVFPGHDYKGRNISTVREEKHFNPRLNKGKEEFVKIMSGLQLPYPRLIETALPANLKDGEQE